MNKSILYSIIFVMGLMTATINSVNGTLAGKVGLFESVLVIHLIGLTVSVVYFLVFEKNKSHAIKTTFKILKTKPYLMLGGFIGTFAVTSISFAVQNISVLVVSTALIAGQFIFSFFIDMNGWFGFEKVEMTKRKLASIVVMMVGVALLTF